MTVSSELHTQHRKSWPLRDSCESNLKPNTFTKTTKGTLIQYADTVRKIKITLQWVGLIITTALIKF